MNPAAFEAHIEANIPQPPKGSQTRFRSEVRVGPIIFSNFYCVACGRRSHMDEYTLSIDHKDTWDAEGGHVLIQMCAECVEKVYKAMKRKEGPQLIGSVNREGKHVRPTI